MRLLFSTAELSPLIQSGGLGDAVSGLARALALRGHHVTVVVPAYRDLLRARACPDLREDGALHLDIPGQRLVGRWLVGELFPSVSLVAVDLPALYDRPGLYGDGRALYADNALRFIALARATAYRASTERPDVVVAHDHHAALALVVLRTALDRVGLRGIGTVQVVHNNAYQGRCRKDDFALTGLPVELLHPDALEAYDTLCLLKGGVGWADRVVAVSETYAREIQEPPMGEGLDALYRARAHRLVGIANGIDAVRFDPATDPALVSHFSKDDIEGKRRCRQALLDELRLDRPEDGLLLVAVGRFAEQKGWDVIATAARPLVARGATLALLGDGDPRIADALAHVERAHPTRVRVVRAYDEHLARRLYAGGDAVLVPSRFEPCGLVQLIGQRYGTVPVAHATGGLVDTIADPAFESTDEPMTGVLFAPLSSDALVAAVTRVRALAEQERLDELRRRMMAKDVSWSAPALRWERVLEDVAREARGRR